MSYQPHLIANYATGIDVRLQPWLSPNDAQEELFDGFVYRGVMSKRPGYRYFATGEKGGVPYCESRVVGDGEGDRLRSSLGVLLVGNGTPGPYVFQTQKADVRRGSVRITAGAQQMTDTGLDGTGNLVPSVPGSGTGTINYRTGVGTVTFNANVPGATAIFINYRWQVDEPVMGVMIFVDASNNKKMIIGTTKRLNIYNSNTNRLDPLSNSYHVNGVTLGSPTILSTIETPNLSVGDSVYIYGLGAPNDLNGNTYIVLAVGANSITIDVDSTLFPVFSGNGFAQQVYTGDQFNFWSWVNYKNKDGDPRLIFTNNKDQVQYYDPNNTPQVADYILYPAIGAPDFLMYADGTTNPLTTFTALQTLVYKDRLQFQRTTEDGTIKPQRLRISGTGVNCDNFTTAATGAGFIDVPDETWIQGNAPNRDDIEFFTEASSWIEQYTGNDTVPITLKRIDESRGSNAAFGVITYLNRTTAPSKRGLIISDGYRVERSDGVIPDFSFNDIDQDNFELCFVGIVDEDRDHYLLYPTPGQTQSKRILTTNYEEDNYAIYRIPMSCMGTFLLSFDVTWNDLTVYQNWDQLAQAYSTWNDFAFSKGTPFSVGGGHHGEVWQLNINEIDDNIQKIRNITIIDSTTLEVTTDWNNFSLNLDDETQGEDFIYFTGVLGMLEVNGKQYPIKSITNNNVFRVNVPSTTGFSAYTANSGTATRVIPFTALFKKFNPYVEIDKKVRCGWIYFYVSVSQTKLTRNVGISGITNANPAVISTALNHGFTTGQQIELFGIGGTTQLNGTQPFITVINSNQFSLDGIDSTAYGVYTSGGYATVPENAALQVQITTNDANNDVRIENLSAYPLQANCSNLLLQNDTKKWYKLFVNQVGKFIQFRINNQQAGANISVHATILGFQPVGRLI